MRTTNTLAVVAALALGSAARADAPAGDSSWYPDTPAVFDGETVVEDTVIDTGDVRYTGPRTVYLKRLPAPTYGSVIANDDATYPTADPAPARPGRETPAKDRPTLADCTCCERARGT